MAGQNQTMHEAEAYLRNTENPTSLYVVIDGKRRKLFINRKENAIGIIAQGKRIRGYLFNDWNTIEKVLYPQTDNADADRIREPHHDRYGDRRQVHKAPHVGKILRKRSDEPFHGCGQKR